MTDKASEDSKVSSVVSLESTWAPWVVWRSLRPQCSVWVSFATNGANIYSQKKERLSLAHNSWDSVLVILFQGRNIVEGCSGGELLTSWLPRSREKSEELERQMLVLIVPPSGPHSFQPGPCPNSAFRCVLMYTSWSPCPEQYILTDTWSI